jgi:hypothetical protein
MNTNRFRTIWSGACLVALLVAFMGSPAFAAPGAIFTTDVGCGGVDLNIYDAREDVYLNGGPAGGGPGLPDGSYYVQVTEPDGALLGSSVGTANPTPVTIVGGAFQQCYQLVEIVETASLPRSAGYDLTTNPGGEYKVWVSSVAGFTNSDSKTDNFKVKAPAEQASLTIQKFYDANANGLDDDNQPIAGWQVTTKHFDHSHLDWVDFTPVTRVVDPYDYYVVSESMPVETNWRATTPTSQNVTLNAGDEGIVKFGNLCLGGGGGLTLGFWSNKNGAALFGADDLALMVSLNLRNGDGTNFDPPSYAKFRTWILSATATNMAYMLSAQLAAMELNVNNGMVGAGSLVYAPGATSANSLGYTTIGALMTEANASLGANGSTVAAGPDRTYQEALKNALDRANNNLNFVQGTPCAFSFAAIAP